MKKITILFAALSAVTILSCSKEQFESDDLQAVSELKNPVTLTFTSAEPSKVAIDAQGKASWEAGDKISVVSFDTEGKACLSTSQEVVINQGVGSFTVTVEAESPYYYAVYPATLLDAQNLVDEQGRLIVPFKNNKPAATTPGGAAYYAAKTMAGGTTFNFKAISTILKLTTAKENASSIYFRPYDATLTYLQGNVPVAFTVEGAIDSLAKPASGSSANIAFATAGPGTYYCAVPASGQSTGGDDKQSGFVLRLTEKDGDVSFNHPAAMYTNVITLTPGKIYNFSNPIESKFIYDYYISPDGTGDGLSAGSPTTWAGLKSSSYGFKSNTIAASTIINNITVHFTAGTYTDPLNLITTNTYGGNHTINFEGATSDSTIFKASSTTNFPDPKLVANIRNIHFKNRAGIAVAVTNGADVNFTNCVFEKNVNPAGGASGNGAAVTVTATSHTSFESCRFLNNKAANGAALTFNAGSGIDDTHVICECNNCLFSGNAATASGGAILIAQGTKSGRILFNGSRFGSNTAAVNGGIFYCNNTTAGTAPFVFFNGCSFAANKSSTEAAGLKGYEVYANNGTRMGINNCTFTITSYDKVTQGTSVLMTGTSVVANTDFWCANSVGKLSTIFIEGPSEDAKSDIVNCVVHQKNKTTTSYASFYARSSSYMSVYNTIYENVKTDENATEGTHYWFTDCFNLGIRTSTLAGAKAVSKELNGITQSSYNWTFNAAIYPGFTPAPKADVIARVEANSIVGTAFSAWLKTLGSTANGAYDVDIFGNARPDTNMTPGSLHQTWSEK